MNREFVFQQHYGRPSAWARAGATLNRWLWVAFCCGVPGVPCHHCSCCDKRDAYDQDVPCADQATATVDRLARPHRPHAPGRKSRPEMLSAVRCALSQLQGEPAPPPTPPFNLHAVVGRSEEPG